MIAVVVRGIPSPRQVEVLAFIRFFTKSRHYPPTVREIGDAVGLRSSSTVQAHLDVLEQKKGLISRASGRSTHGARTIVVIEDEA